MKRLCLLLSLGLLALLACTPAPADSAQAESPAPVPAEEQAVNRVVSAAYNLISFDPGTVPDYELLQSLFLPAATLYNFRGDSLEYLPIDQFLADFRAAIEREEITAFREAELGGETEYFGNVAHRISSYETYSNGDLSVVERGVNSFQLLKIDGRWRINSITWDVEREGQAIPERYLTE
jgi:hypothetical protein